MAEPIQIHLTIDRDHWLKMLNALNETISRCRDFVPHNDIQLLRLCDLRSLLIITSLQ